MAFGFVGKYGANNSPTDNLTQITFTTTAAANVGHYIVLLIAVDNNDTGTDVATISVTGVTDNSGAGNTWVSLKEYTNGLGAAGAGTTCAIWGCKIAGSTASGTTVTIAFNNSASRDAAAVVASQFTINSSNNIEIDAFTHGPGISPSTITLTTSNVECLRIIAEAGETNDATNDLVAGGWSSICGSVLTGMNSTGGGGATNQAIRGVFKISTGTTGDASFSNWLNVDDEYVYVALKEVPAGVTGTLAQTLASVSTFVGSLLHFDGTDGSTSFVDVGGHRWTAVAGAQIDTAQSKFGGSSLLSVRSSGYLFGDGSRDFDIGSGDDYTIDFWMRPSTIGGGQIYYVFDTRATAVNAGIAININDSSLRVAFYDADGFNQFIGATTLAINTWYHVALTRSGGNARLFLNGILEEGPTVRMGAYPASANRPIIGAEAYSPPGAGFDGWLDELRVVKYAVWTSNFTAPTAPHLDSTLRITSPTPVSLLHFDGAFADSAGRGHRWTPVGNAQIDTAQSKFGGASLLLDGSGDYVTGDGSQDFAFGTGDFTVDFWVRLNGGLGSGVNFCDGRLSAVEDIGAVIYKNSSDRINVFIGGADRIVGATTLTTGVWYHIALLRSGVNTKLFLNGTQEGSTYSDSNNYLGTSGPYIGANYLGEAALNGWIDEFRCVKSALWTSNFIPPTGPALDVFPPGALLHFDVSFVGSLLHFDGADASTSFIDVGGHTWTAVGNAQIDTAQSKFGGSSALCTDVTGGIAGDGSNDFAFGTGDFTIEFWVNLAVVNANSVNVFYDSRPAAGGEGLYPLIATVSGSWWYHLSGGSVIQGGSFATGTWYHVAVCRVSGITRLFVNGTQVGSNYSGRHRLVVAANRPIIGNVTTLDGTSPTNGWIDDLRIVKYAVYTANFTPPAAPLGQIGPIIDEYGHAWTAFGNAQIDTAQSKFGGASLLLDGTGDYVLGDGSNDFAFTGDFTVEFWFRLNALPSGFFNLYDMRNVGDSIANHFVINVSSSGLVNFQASGSINGSTSVSANTWYHLSVTRSGTSIKLFLNGTQEGSTLTDSTNYVIGISRPALGVNGTDLSGDALNGRIDELRVLKYAVWT